MEYIYVSFQKLLDNIGDHSKVESIPYNIECDMNIYNSYDEWFNLFSVPEKRVNMIEMGINIAAEIYPSFLEKYKKMNEHGDEITETDHGICISREGEKGEKGEK